jgi:hypothetical protein
MDLCEFLNLAPRKNGNINERELSASLEECEAYARPDCHLGDAIHGWRLVTSAREWRDIFRLDASAQMSL